MHLLYQVGKIKQCNKQNTKSRFWVLDGLVNIVTIIIVIVNAYEVHKSVAWE